MIPSTADPLEIQNMESSIEPYLYHPMPLRIGLLMDHPSPHMVALLEAVAARKDCTLEVLYCGQSDPGREWGSPAGNISHQFIEGFVGPLGLSINPGILRAMSQKHVDIWIVNTIYGSWTTWMAVAWLRFRKIPWVYMNEPVRPRTGMFALLKELPLKFVLRRTNGIIGTGKAAAEMYRRRATQDVPCESVPYFIDLSGFLDLSVLSAPTEGQDLQFIASCQMIKRKGLDYLLQACKKLPETGWHLTLIGDGPLRSVFESEYAPLVNSGKVTFSGAIPYRHRETAFKNQHIFVFPSLWDGWGMVLPEALAAGLPVISTDQVVSAHDFIRDGDNGFIVPAADAQALADKMKWFLNNFSRLPQMSRAARKSLADYTPETGAETLVSFLNHLYTSLSRRSSATDAPCRADEITWRLIETPPAPYYKTKLALRSMAKESLIRTRAAIHRPKKARGNIIVAYHLVLKEDRKNFADHLKFFRDHFQVRPLHNLLEFPNSLNPEEFSLAITFDDGFRLLMQDCLEILEQHGIKATFYVPTAFIQASGQPEKAADLSIRSFYYSRPMEPMRPEDLKKLTMLGHEVGSHGLFHTGIHAMTPKTAECEFSASSSMISRWTGIMPNGFAYPYGGAKSIQGDPADWLRKSGFAYAVTLDRGSVDPSTNPFALPRHHVEGNWSLPDLKYFLLE